jgi:hypothetical protein
MAPAGRSCWERRRCDRPPHRATSRTPRGTPPPPSRQPATATTFTSGTGPCFPLAGGLCKFYAYAGEKRPIQRQLLVVQYKQQANPLFINEQLYSICVKQEIFCLNF